MSEKKEFKPLDVGATERVDWKVAQGLSKYVHFDENGNATFKKNLTADGTIGGNKGLKPIKEYDFISGEKLIILDERTSVADGWNVGFGYIDDNANAILSALFNYSLDNGKITGFYGVTNGGIYELVGDQLVQKSFVTQ